MQILKSGVMFGFYLCSITKLHIGCSSGMSAVPKIFKKNIVGQTLPLMKVQII